MGDALPAAGDRKDANRAAQKRYRERQKGKMEAYKQQVDELSARLERLQAEREGLEQRKRLLETVAGLSVARPTAAAAPALGAAEAGGGGRWGAERTHAALAGFVGAVRRQRQPALTPADAAGISPEGLRSVWQEYVRELAALMLACGEGRHAGRTAELEAYVLQNRQAILRLVNSMSVRSFADLLVLKRRRIFAASSISPRLMAAVGLSPDQTQALLTARAALLTRTERLKQQRRAILTDLQAAEPSVACVMRGQTGGLQQALESSQRFQASLEQEHASIAAFHSECMQVFSPLQEARCVLEAHPGSPDLWLITGYLEAEQRGCLGAWLAAHCTEQQAQGSRGPLAAAGTGPDTGAAAAGAFPSAALLPGDSVDLDAMADDMRLDLLGPGALPWEAQA